MTKRAFAFAASFFVVIATAYANPANHTANASFETADPSHANLAAYWQIYGSAYTRVASSSAWDQSYVMQTIANEGAVQHISLYQSVWTPVRISVRIKGESIANDSSDNLGASLDCKIAFHDGTFAWCPTTAKTKNVGTFDWKWVGYNTASISSSMSPIDWIEVRLRMGAVAGTAWFDDVHVEEWTPHTGGMVTFMFDDSFLSTYTKAYPMLFSKGYPGTEAAVTSYIGADSLHMSWDQLRMMYNHGWSVVSHTVTHPDLTTLSLTALNDELYFSQKTLVDNGFPVHHLALPFGAYNALVITRAQAEWYGGYNYQSVRSSDSGVNPQGVFPYNTEVHELTSNTTVNDVNAWLADAQDRKSWLIFLIHEIDNQNGIYTITSSMFQSVINAVSSSGLPVYTYDLAFTQMTQ